MWGKTEPFQEEKEVFCIKTNFVVSLQKVTFGLTNNWLWTSSKSDCSDFKIFPFSDPMLMNEVDLFVVVFSSRVQFNLTITCNFWSSINLMFLSCCLVIAWVLHHLSSHLWFQVSLAIHGGYVMSNLESANTKKKKSF